MLLDKMILDINMFGLSVMLVYSTIDNRSIIVCMNSDWDLLCQANLKEELCYPKCLGSGIYEGYVLRFDS